MHCHYSLQQFLFCVIHLHDDLELVGRTGQTTKRKDEEEAKNIQQKKRLITLIYLRYMSSFVGKKFSVYTLYIKKGGVKETLDVSEITFEIIMMNKSLSKLIIKS